MKFYVCLSISSHVRHIRDQFYCFTTPEFLTELKLHVQGTVSIG